ACIASRSKIDIPWRRQILVEKRQILVQRLKRRQPFEKIRLFRPHGLQDQPITLLADDRLLSRQFEIGGNVHALGLTFVVPQQSDMSFNTHCEISFRSAAVCAPARAGASLTASPPTSSRARPSRGPCRPSAGCPFRRG